jgi:hypothetical protein
VLPSPPGRYPDAGHASGTLFDIGSLVFMPYSLAFPHFCPFLYSFSLAALLPLFLPPLPSSPYLAFPLWFFQTAKYGLPLFSCILYPPLGFFVLINFLSLVGREGWGHARHSLFVGRTSPVLGVQKILQCVSGRHRKNGVIMLRTGSRAPPEAPTGFLHQSRVFARRFIIIFGSVWLELTLPPLFD